MSEVIELLESIRLMMYIISGVLGFIAGVLLVK